MLGGVPSGCGTTLGRSGPCRSPRRCKSSSPLDELGDERALVDRESADDGVEVFGFEVDEDIGRKVGELAQLRDVFVVASEDVGDGENDLCYVRFRPCHTFLLLVLHCADLGEILK